MVLADCFSAPSWARPAREGAHSSYLALIAHPGVGYPARGVFHQAMVDFSTGDIVGESFGLSHRTRRAGHDVGRDP